MALRPSRLPIYSHCQQHGTGVWGGRDVAGEGSCPRFGGFMSVHPVWGQGSLVVVWAGQLGEAGRRTGVGRTPRIPRWVPHLDCLPCCHAGVSSSLLVGKLIRPGQATGLYRELVELNRDAYLPNLRVPGRVPTSTP